jgi:hypothetical protein
LWFWNASNWASLKGTDLVGLKFEMVVVNGQKNSSSLALTKIKSELYPKIFYNSLKAFLNLQWNIFKTAFLEGWISIFNLVWVGKFEIGWESLSRYQHHIWLQVYPFVKFSSKKMPFKYIFLYFNFFKYLTVLPYRFKPLWWTHLH